MFACLAFESLEFRGDGGAGGGVQRLQGGHPHRLAQSTLFVLGLHRARYGCDYFIFCLLGVSELSAELLSCSGAVRPVVGMEMVRAHFR